MLALLLPLSLPLLLLLVVLATRVGKYRLYSLRRRSRHPVPRVTRAAHPWHNVAVRLHPPPPHNPPHNPLHTPPPLSGGFHPPLRHDHRRRRLVRRHGFVPFSPLPRRERLMPGDAAGWTVGWETTVVSSDRTLASYGTPPDGQTENSSFDWKPTAPRQCQGVVLENARSVAPPERRRRCSGPLPDAHPHALSKDASFHALAAILTRSWSSQSRQCRCQRHMDVAPDVASWCLPMAPP